MRMHFSALLPILSLIQFTHGEEEKIVDTDLTVTGNTLHASVDPNWAEMTPVRISGDQVNVTSIEGLLGRRQTCRNAGYGVCFGAFCCPSSDSCCPTDCCPYGRSGNCCRSGGCCSSAEYCTVGDNGKEGCCPNGKICRGNGGIIGSTQTFTEDPITTTRTRTSTRTSTSTSFSTSTSTSTSSFEFTTTAAATATRTSTNSPAATPTTTNRVTYDASSASISWTGFTWETFFPTCLVGSTISTGKRTSSSGNSFRFTFTSGTAIYLSMTCSGAAFSIQYEGVTTTIGDYFGGYTNTASGRGGCANDTSTIVWSKTRLTTSSSRTVYVEVLDAPLGEMNGRAPWTLDFNQFVVEQSPSTSSNTLLPSQSSSSGSNLGNGVQIARSPNTLAVAVIVGTTLAFIFYH